MENLLKAIPNVVVFQDDVMITGRNDAEHLCNLEAVLKRLVEAGVSVKRDKCRFMLPQVEFVGRIVSADGLRPSTSKTEAINDAPTPANMTELKAFLGMLNYYCNFLRNLSTVLEPFHKLLRIGVEWRWCTQCSKAFGEAKLLLCSSKVLVYYDTAKPLVLNCDASSFGIGCVLQQRNACILWPVAYASRTLSAAERDFSMVEKEALA